MSTIRPYASADRDAVYSALTRIYGDGMPVAPERELPTDREHYVAMDGTVCAGIYAELPFNTYRGEAKLITGGLAMVGVVPERRHTGLGGDLMRFALRNMRSKGRVLASLYPFSESFYRQFGYELCGSRIKFACHTRLLPKFDPELPVRQLKSDELASVKPCYEHFAKSRSGLSDRPQYMWERLFGRSSKSETPVYEKTVYAAGDPVEAYVVIKHDVAFHVEQEVLELAWATIRGYESIMGLTRSLAANKSGLSWWEPSDSLFLSRYVISAPLSKISLDKLIMYRVLDVPGALSAIRPLHEFTPFSLSVQDLELPENVGPWRVACQNGSITVEPSDSADLEFDIRSFTQALLGQPSIDDVIRNGTALAKDEKAVTAFRQLMPPSPVYCLDLF